VAKLKVRLEVSVAADGENEDSQIAEEILEFEEQKIDSIRQLRVGLLAAARAFITSRHNYVHVAEELAKLLVEKDGKLFFKPAALPVEISEGGE